MLLICDGLSHVQSRMGMLDVFGALFTLAAFATLICDRDDVRARMAVVLAEGRVDDSPYGPRLGVRWWRFATGVLLGLGCAVKWSGVYWLAAFAVLTLIFDATARRAAGVRRPWVGTLVRDVAPAVWVLALLPVLVYVGVVVGVVPQRDGHRPQRRRARPRRERHRSGRAVGVRARRAAVAVVLQRRTFSTSTPGSRRTSSGQHPWESKPWTWPMGLRPMLYYYASGEKVTGCGTGECISAVMLIGTPALWWPAIPVLAWGLWRAVARSDWRYGAVLVGYGAGVLPWLANIDRQMYFFYMAPVAPFLVLATTLVMGQILGRADDPWERRQTGLRPWGCGSGSWWRTSPTCGPSSSACRSPGGVGRAAVAAVVAPLIIRFRAVSLPRRAARSPSAPARRPSAAARSAARAARTGPAAPRRPGRATRAPR